MNRVLSVIFGLAVAWPLAARAQGPEAADTRQKVDMPPAAAAVFREEMRAKTLGLHRALAALADKQPAAVADEVEQLLGMGAMGLHARLPRDARPGLYAPDELRQLGMQSHRQGSALAAALMSGDRPRIDAALRDLTATCVACHASYRIH